MLSTGTFAIIICLCIVECEGQQTIQSQEEERRSVWSEETERETQRGACDRGNTSQTGNE